MEIQKNYTLVLSELGVLVLDINVFFERSIYGY